MEEREQIREREPELQEDVASLRYIRELKKRRAMIYLKPRVLRPRPGERHPHGRDKIPYEPIEEWGYPIYGMRYHVTHIKPSGYGYQHRHFFEAVFYVIGGAGYEIHDGVRYDWSAGDVMAVPPYTVHRHFNPNPTEDAIFFIVIPVVHGFLGLEQYEEFDFPIDMRPADDFVDEMGQWGQDFSQRILDMRTVEHVENGHQDEYEEMLGLLAEENRRHKTVSHVIKPQDALPWQNTRFGRMQYLVHPKLRNKIATSTLDVYVQEIPPGGYSGKHIHFAEELHYILDGRGYDIQDGVRYDWQKGDVVAVPVMSEHQHFNADPDHPAKFVSVMPATYRAILHGGIKHLADASDWKP